jgi:hypothetical protein
MGTRIKINFSGKLFDDYWWEKKEAKKGNPGPFHILGKNCSSFAYKSFKDLDLLSTKMRGIIDTPDKLFRLLVSSLKGKCQLKCFSGFVGFNPSEKTRRNRIGNRDCQYEIIIDNCKTHSLM